MNWILQFLGATLLIVVTCIQTTVGLRVNNKVQIKRAMGNSKPPMIKMMRRRVRVSEHGQRASITLVFYTTRDTYIRWFHREEDEYNPERLGGAEITGYFPIDGDKRYKMRYLVAGGVVAATLHIPKYSKSQDQEVFQTVITTYDGRLQYNLLTIIDNTVEGRASSLTVDINGPEWDWIPEDKEFEVGGLLEIGCQVFIPEELVQKTVDNAMTNELFFSKYNGSRSVRSLPRNATIPSVADNILRVQAPVDLMAYANWTEQITNDPKVVTGFRQPYKKLGHALYEAKMTTKNASADLEGIYQCTMDRWQGMNQFEKSYAIGEATIKSKYPATSASFSKWVYIVVKPCDTSAFKKGRLELQSGQKSCLRCVAMGESQHKVDLTRGGSTLKSRSDVTAVKSINVADAGVSEVTYIFHNPTKDLTGAYRCEVKTLERLYLREFHIEVRN